MLPVVSTRKNTSTGAEVAPAVIVTVLWTEVVKPVSPVALNVAGEIESARTGEAIPNNKEPTVNPNRRKDVDFHVLGAQVPMRLLPFFYIRYSVVMTCRSTYRITGDRESKNDTSRFSSARSSY
jgi:hypothetical protein